MLGLGTQADGILSSTHEVTEGFISGRRNVDRRELAGAMSPRQGVAIPPIGLDPIPLRFGMLEGFTTVQSSPYAVR
jgi:hypothetical protein